MLKIRYVLILILSMIICSGFANKPNDALLIYGDGFSFKVNEPENWRCYTADAGKYGLNAYFCMGSENFDNAAGGNVYQSNEKRKPKRRRTSSRRHGGF